MSIQLLEVRFKLGFNHVKSTRLIVRQQDRSAPAPAAGNDLDHACSPVLRHAVKALDYHHLVERQKLKEQVERTARK